MLFGCMWVGSVQFESMFVILFIGFELFVGFDCNLLVDVVEVVVQGYDGFYDFVVVILLVVFDIFVWYLWEFIVQYFFDVVVVIGFVGGSVQIVIECFGVNLIDVWIFDNDGV